MPVKEIKKYCKICKSKISKWSILGFCKICSNKYAHKRGKTKYYCKNCQKEISYNPKIQGSGWCKSCSHKGKRNGMYGKNRPDLSKRNKLNRIYPQNYCLKCHKKIALQYKHCKKHAYEVMRGMKKPKLSIKFLGKNNPSYIHGLSRLPYPLEFNNILKEQIRKRDKYICQKCYKNQKNHYRGNKKIKLTIHHIDYNPINLLKSNLITLCDKCNKQVNFNRDYWYAYFRYIMENYIYEKDTNLP